MVLASASLAVTPGTSDSAEEIRILRDPWGVPHILAESDYGALYGHGWSLAEDQLVNALSALWTVQGRRTEIDGPGAVGLDRTMRLMRVHADIADAWPNYDEEYRNACVGFSDGINAWMKANPDQVPAWAEPVEPTWGLALGRVIDFIPQVRRANGKARRIAPELIILRNNGDINNYEQVGSNAWAVDGGRTESGETVMLTDPHLPWLHEFRLYEAHMRGKTFECAGASFVGVPLPQFARNANVAWGWTWNGPDHADVYRLTLDPKDSGRYLFDGESIPFERTETVYRMPDGTEERETLLASVHGPITHVDEEKGYAVAYRLSALGQSNTGAQYLEMLRARNLDELQEAMAQLQVCHFNQVASDTRGDIRYLWGGRIPVRPEGVDFTKVMDGSTSATLWEADAVVPLAKMPQVNNPPCGFVQNCNNSPSTTTGTEADPQPDTYPAGAVRSGRSDTGRAWYLRKRLAVNEKLSIDDCRDIATDSYMIPHEPMSRLLAHSWETYGEDYPERDAIAENVREILGWDGEPRVHTQVPTIFTLWLWKTFNRTALPVSLLEKTVSEVDEAFATKLFDGMLAAQEELRSLVPLPNVPWGMMHIIRRENRVWPVETGMYPAISLMNANLVPKGRKLEDLNCVVGSAYVGFHVMDENGMRSESIMPLGQTDRTDLPYVDAMTDLFVMRELKPLPFTDEELAEVETTETVLVLPPVSERGR